MQDEQTTNFSFPCDFQFKVFGLANDKFEIAVLSIIRKYVPHLAENAIQTRASKDGKYLSISITIRADSKEQLDNIYRELSSNEHVIMAL